MVILAVIVIVAVLLTVTVSVMAWIIKLKIILK